MLSSPFIGNGGINYLYGQDDLDFFLNSDSDVADFTGEEVWGTS